MSYRHLYTGHVNGFTRIATTALYTCESRETIVMVNRTVYEARRQRHPKTFRIGLARALTRGLS